MGTRAKAVVAGPPALTLLTASIYSAYPPLIIRIHGFNISDGCEADDVKIALGFKAHSGWAAMVAVAYIDRRLTVIDRRRVELVEDGEAWAKQPYHAAENLPSREAAALVLRGIAAAGKVSKRRFREIIRWADEASHEVVACGVLVPGPMPKWTTAEILSVHFRMHKAEGVLFPAALCHAGESKYLNVAAIPEKRLDRVAEERLGLSLKDLMNEASTLGRAVGPPWGKDQKLATMAAMIASGRNDQSRPC